MQSVREDSSALSRPFARCDRECSARGCLPWRGTYAIEAGRSGIVQVTGIVSRSAVKLVVQYDFGLVQTFNGALADADHFVGTFDRATARATFTRR